MEKGPQYISSIWKRVHNILVQYGKGTLVQYRKVYTIISSIWKKVHNYITSYG